MPVNFSPVHPGLDPAQLAQWIGDDGLRVRLNLQLHKYIWGADGEGVGRQAASRPDAPPPRRTARARAPEDRGCLGSR